MERTALAEMVNMKAWAVKELPRYGLFRHLCHLDQSPPAPLPNTPNGDLPPAAR